MPDSLRCSESGHHCAHVWTSHVTHMKDSCHTYEWVMCHIYLSHVTRMNESCYTYEWVMPHIWLRHATHTHRSTRPFDAMRSLGSPHCSPPHRCPMTPSYLTTWHLTLVWDMTRSKVAWLIHTCNMTRSYVWRDSCICDTWLIHMCDMNPSYEWHDSFIHVHNDDMTHHTVMSQASHTHWHTHRYTYRCVSMWRLTHIEVLTHIQVYRSVYITTDTCICLHL